MSADSRTWAGKRSPSGTVSTHPVKSRPRFLRLSVVITNIRQLQGRIYGRRGGGGGGRPPSGIRPPVDPKGPPPPDTFSEIHFWPTDPKIFLKAPLAPIYTNFEGERAPKKNAIFCQNFSKSAQKRLFDYFFNGFLTILTILTAFWLFWLCFDYFDQNRGKTVVGRAQKINLVDLKKKARQNFRFFFENPPPLEKILDPPLRYFHFSCF